VSGRHAVPYTVKDDVLVEHDCPVFGVVVVSEAPYQEQDGRVVPVCGCWPASWQGRS
jgi:hypothetical protein